MIMGSKNPNMEWLGRAIASADGLFDEYILVDDGSTPPISWSNKFYSGVTRIRHRDNLGLAEAKNSAISQARSDVICVLDDDDYFDRGGVTKLKEFIKENDSDVWHFHLREFGLSEGIYGENANPSYLTDHNSVPGVSWFRKSAWEDVGGFKKVRAEDWLFWLKLLRSGKRFKYFPEVAYHVNVRPGSASRSWGVPFEEIKKEVMENL